MTILHIRIVLFWQRDQVNNKITNILWNVKPSAWLVVQNPGALFARGSYMNYVACVGTKDSWFPEDSLCLIFGGQE